jgi:hypothetical protein
MEPFFFGLAAGMLGAAVVATGRLRLRRRLPRT